MVMKKFLISVFMFLTVKSYSQQTFMDKFNIFLTEWVHVPYKYGGTTKRGIDCSAFTQKIFNQVFDLVIPRTASRQFKFTERIEKELLEFGDLVFFRSKLSPSGWHVGFYIGESKFVHAANKKEDIKVSSLQEDKYQNTFLGGGRVPQMIPKKQF